MRCLPHAFSLSLLKSYIYSIYLFDYKYLLIYIFLRSGIVLLMFHICTLILSEWINWTWTFCLNDPWNIQYEYLWSLYYNSNWHVHVNERYILYWATTHSTYMSCVHSTNSLSLSYIQCLSFSIHKKDGNQFQLVLHSNASKFTYNAVPFLLNQSTKSTDMRC